MDEPRKMPLTIGKASILLVGSVGFYGTSAVLADGGADRRLLVICLVLAIVFSLAGVAGILLNASQRNRPNQPLQLTSDAREF